MIKEHIQHNNYNVLNYITIVTESTSSNELAGLALSPRTLAARNTCVWLYAITPHLVDIAGQAAHRPAGQGHAYLDGAFSFTSAIFPAVIS